MHRTHFQKLEKVLLTAAQMLSKGVHLFQKNQLAGEARKQNKKKRASNKRDMWKTFETHACNNRQQEL